MDDQNRSHGKIDNLPADLKHEVENRLLNGETYEEISNYLKDQGEEVHLSSVGRYGRKSVSYTHLTLPTICSV